MRETILAGVLTGVIMLIVGALAGRITIRTKTAKRVNDMGQKMIRLEKKLDEHLVESEERN